MSGKLNHLGMNKAPARTTKKFKFKNKLYSLDASIIDVSVKLFDWAKYRRTKGAVKLHLLLDHDGYLSAFMAVTEGNVHEINIARNLKLSKGSIVAMDKGYYDYSLFDSFTENEVYFVTRTKKNIKLDSTNCHIIIEVSCV